jgi:hypothetical protein
MIRIPCRDCARWTMCAQGNVVGCVGTSTSQLTHGLRPREETRESREEILWGESVARRGPTWSTALPSFSHAGRGTGRCQRPGSRTAGRSPINDKQCPTRLDVLREPGTPWAEERKTADGPVLSIHEAADVRDLEYGGTTVLVAVRTTSEPRPPVPRTRPTFSKSTTNNAPPGWTSCASPERSGRRNEKRRTVPYSKFRTRRP